MSTGFWTLLNWASSTLGAYAFHLFSSVFDVKTGQKSWPWLVTSFLIPFFFIPILGPLKSAIILYSWFRWRWNIAKTTSQIFGQRARLGKKKTIPLDSLPGFLQNLEAVFLWCPFSGNRTQRRWSVGVYFNRTKRTHNHQNLPSDLLITQTEVTFSPLKRSLKIPKRVTGKNLACCH